MFEETYKLIFKFEDYWNNRKDEIKILDKDFIIRSGNKGKLIINNKKGYFRDVLYDEYTEETYFKIKMIFYEDIYDKSYIFKNCEDLVDFSYEANK